MARFILVHGSWHGAWCWSLLKTLLTARGHDVHALDLPGHGADPRDPATVQLADYAASILEAIEQGSAPAILVGHSTAGISITTVAEQAPTRVAALVYLTAALPAYGRSLMDLAYQMDPRYVEQIEWSPDGRTATPRQDAVRDFIYASCSPDVVNEAIPRLSAEPTSPFSENIHTTPGRFGRVPKHYIECLEDRVFPISMQRFMQSAHSFEGIHSLAANHMAMFTHAEDLSSILHRIASAL